MMCMMVGVPNEALEQLIVKVNLPGDTPSFQCIKCNKVMKRKDHMKNHVRTHFEGQEVACHHCGKVYKNIRSLEVHRSSYHANSIVDLS